MRRAFIGALGLLTVIILLCFTSCKKTDPARRDGKGDTIHLNPGRKLVSCDWNTYGRDVMYITRPMEANEKATEYEYGTKMGTMYIIQEEELHSRDIMDELEVLRQVRLRNE